MPAEPNQDYNRLKQSIEAILFVSGNPVAAKDLSVSLQTDEATVRNLIRELGTEIINRGIVITESGDSFQMATNPEVSEEVKKYIQAQLREKLTPAAVETLAIITYKQPVSKAEIESIRGVNSQYILKLLLQRGMVEKSGAQDARASLYRTTHEFLNHLGIKSLSELPDFEQIVKDLEVDLGDEQDRSTDSPPAPDKTNHTSN